MSRGRYERGLDLEKLDSLPSPPSYPSAGLRAAGEVELKGELKMA